MKLSYTTQLAGKKYVMRAHRWSATYDPHRRADRHAPLWSVRQGRRLIAVFRWDFHDIYDWKGDAKDEEAMLRLRLTGLLDRKAASLAATRDRTDTRYIDAYNAALARHS